MKQNRLTFIFIVFFIICITSIGYLSWQVSQLRYQIATAPTGSVCPAPALSPSPTSTTIPLTSGTPTIRPNQIKYALPTGWSTTQLFNSTFSIGFNPMDMKIISNDQNGLIIKHNSTFSYADMIIQEHPYDGGSRHNFIASIIGGDINMDKLANYHEKEYLVASRNCLFMIGIQPSQSLPTWGMCPVSSTKAVLINLLSQDDKTIESILKTIKFN